MRIARYVVAAALALGGLGLAAPAHAATPQLFLSTHGPVAPDGSVGMIGTGCPAGSPISLDVWDTVKPPSHVDLNNIATAGGSGAFGYTYDLANHFDPGAEIGFQFSCSSAFDQASSSNPLADGSYVSTTISDPHVSIESPPSSTYGTRVEVVVHTDAINGNVVFTADGVEQTYVPGTATGGSHYGYWVYDLPARLATGVHALHASWTPHTTGSSTVTADKTLRVVKVRPTLGLRLSPSTMRVGSTTAARVTLSQTGIAPRTGKVVLKKNGRIVATGQIRAADNGVRIFAVRIRTVGTYHLTAVFLGTSTLARATSPTRTLTVHR